MATKLPLNGFYAGESQKNIAQRCANWVPVKQPGDALSDFSLFPTAGISGPIHRAGTVSGELSGDVTTQSYQFAHSYSLGEVNFCVANRLYTTDGANITSRSIPNTGVSVTRTDYGRFASSGEYLAFVAPAWANLNKDYAFSMDKASTVTAIDLATIFGVTPSEMADVAFINGRFLWMSEATVGTTAYRVYYSDIGAVEPNPLQFFAPDSATTQFRGIHSNNGQVLLFTEDRTFVFAQTTSETTPFQWQAASTIDVGLLNPHCKDDYKGTTVILGRRKGEGYRVMLLTGGDAQPISTKAIDYVINLELADIGHRTARVFTYSEKGRDITCVSVGQWSFHYDHDTQVWFERRSNSTTDEPWRVSGFGFSGTKPVYVSSVSVGASTTDYYVGNPDENLGTEFGEMLERYVITAPFNADNRPLRMAEIEPQCEVDLTVPAVGFENPKIAIAPSYDFGNTFESERSLNIGSSGNYTERTRFLNFGLVRQAVVYKMRAKAPYPVRLLKILARVMPGGRES